MTNDDIFDDGQQVDADGALLNGFDYSLQVWVIGGVVQNCGHVSGAAPCCNARRYAGQCVKYIDGHEIRRESLCKLN